MQPATSAAARRTRSPTWRTRTSPPSPRVSARRPHRRPTTPPEITGTADAGSTVELYATGDCSGAIVASGTAAAFATPGLAVIVADDSTTTYSATASNGPNVSACSPASPTSRTRLRPLSRTASGSTPAPPANDNAPRITGSADAGSTVKLYATNDCSGSVEATGTAAAFSSTWSPGSGCRRFDDELQGNGDRRGRQRQRLLERLRVRRGLDGAGSADQLRLEPRLPGQRQLAADLGQRGGSLDGRALHDDRLLRPVEASGTAAAFSSPGLAVAVADDSTTSLKATATDAAGNVSGCSSAYVYVEDSTAPAAPDSLGATPAGPANDNSPKISGNAEAGSTVKLYTTNDCSGAVAASGPAAAFGSPGLAVAVADDSTTTFKATSTDAAGNVSGCSTGITYVEDSTAPAAPASLDSTPAPPANDNAPAISGNAAASSTVKLYATTDCSGSVVASGTAAAFGSPGFTIAVSDDSTTNLTATATDAVGNVSGCSSAYVYVEDSTTPSSTVGFPSAGGNYSPSAWNAGCATAGFCGTASDSPGSGLQMVEISIRRGTGNYYDGSSFSERRRALPDCRRQHVLELRLRHFPIPGGRQLHDPCEGDGQRRKRRELLVTHLRLRRLGAHGPDPRLLGLHERERDRPDGLLPPRRRRRLHRERPPRATRSPASPATRSRRSARAGAARRAAPPTTTASTASAADPVEPNDVTRSEQRRPHLEHELHRHARRARPGDARSPATALPARPAGTRARSRSASRQATAASGVQEIRYTTDGSDPSPVNGTVYSAPFSLGATTTVKFRAYDRVGNEETVGSQLVRIDTTAPAAPTLTLSESPGSPKQHVSGTTLFYNPQGGNAGSFTVGATTSDPQSGIDRVTFPALDGMTRRRRRLLEPVPGQLLVDERKQRLRLADRDRSQQRGSHRHRRASRPRLTRLPRAAVRSTTSNGYAAGSVTVTTDDGNDGLSGVDAATGVIERDSTNLVGGICDPFAGSWSVVTSPDSTVAAGNCYRYRYRVSDNVGNNAVYTSGNVVKVSTSAPSVPNLTLAEAPGSPVQHVAGATLFYNPSGGQRGHFHGHCRRDQLRRLWHRPRQLPEPGRDDRRRRRHDEPVPGGLRLGLGQQRFRRPDGDRSQQRRPDELDDLHGHPRRRAPDRPERGRRRAGYFTSLSVPVTLQNGSDALSGSRSRHGVLERETATLANGSCVAWSGTWNAVTLTGGADTTVQSNRCYHYRYSISDNVGNQSAVLARAPTPRSTRRCR